MMDKKNIEESNLDELLNNLFLEENAAEIQEETAGFVQQQTYAYEMDAGKEKELIRKLNKDLKGPNGYWKLSSIFLIAAIATVTFLYTNYGTTKTEEVKVDPINEDQVTLEKQLFDKPVEDSGLIKLKDSASTDFQKEAIQKTKHSKYNPKELSNGASVYYPVTGVGSKSNATFFKPTEKDLVFFERYKKEMLENLLHTDKNMYCVVEAGKIQYQGKSVDIFPFILRKFTITNLEYKIFLAELIKNGQEDVFKKAAVKNEVWIDYNDNLLATTYFFEEKYNDFPVVNISPEAATLFCDWLEEEINKYSKQINPQAEPMQIRLPNDAELILAKNSGYIPVSDCNSKVNEKNGSIPYELFSINRYGMDENQILQLFEKGFDYKNNLTKKPTDLACVELFSKIAHVSEIVQEKKNHSIKIVGSCWKNKQDYTKMKKAFDATAASPFVGFRAVIVYGSN